METPAYETILRSAQLDEGGAPIGRMIQLYQLYDLVAQQVIGPLIPCPHQAPAVRHFVDLLRDSKTVLAAHPADYALLYVGMQDETTGILVPLSRPQPTLTGAAWLASQNKE